MEFADAVRSRRMVRHFRPDPLPEGSLDRILDLARRAPSAGFAQGTEFLVLEGAESTGRYWEISLPADARPSFPWPGLLEAPALVVVLSNRERYLDRYAEPDKGWADRDPARWPVPYWDVDAGMAAMIMLLAAVDEGLGALFFGVFDRWPSLRAEFGVPPEFTPVGAVAIGVPAAGDRPSGSVTRGRRPLETVVHRGTW